MENSLLSNFAEIWSMTLYYSTGTLADFGATLKIRKKSKLDRNQLKLSIQHKYMYMHQKKIIKLENSLISIFAEIWSMTLCYSTYSRGSLAQFLRKFKNL